MVPGKTGVIRYGDVDRTQHQRDMADLDDAANNIPPQEPAAESLHSGADVFAGLLSHARVDLSVADYTLGALDFATPVLSTPLRVQDYSVEGLEFGAPAICRGYVIWGEVGHPGLIPDDAGGRMIAATTDWLVARRITNLRRISQTDRVALKTYIRGLAKNEGVTASYATLHRRIVQPAVQNAKLRVTP
jgi:hypothetical protein